MSAAIRFWLGTRVSRSEYWDGFSDPGEEILASVLGSLICEEEADRDNLTAKVATALVDHGEAPDTAFLRIEELRKLFGELL